MVRPPNKGGHSACRDLFRPFQLKREKVPKACRREYFPDRRGRRREGGNALFAQERNFPPPHPPKTLLVCAKFRRKLTALKRKERLHTGAGDRKGKAEKEMIRFAEQNSKKKQSFPYEIFQEARNILVCLTEQKRRKRSLKNARDMRGKKGG